MKTYNDHDHARTWPLLPWHAEGRLDAGEEAFVDAHLRTCDTCRAELAWQRQLHGAARGTGHDVPLPDVDAAFARLLPRLDAQPAPAGRASPVQGMLAALLAWLRRAPLLPAAFAAALLALYVAFPSGQQAGYEGLGPVAAAGASATVVFRADTRSGDVRRILAATGATAVRGPTAAGAYVLDIAPGQRADALARLRAEPAVLMAEPLDARVTP
jgi:anti-sigma factor RsiW